MGANGELVEHESPVGFRALMRVRGEASDILLIDGIILQLKCIRKRSINKLD
jgi:hypothetical protein